MYEFFRNLFNTSDFPARWHCGDWSEGHGWLHVISDAAVFGAYAAIPLSISYYAVAKKSEVIFPKLYWLFAGFILSCGVTHLVEASLFWHPWYRFSGLLKLITAIVSWATVLSLVKVLPTALTLPGTAKMNLQLRKEIEDRRASEKAQRETSERLGMAMEHSRLGDWSWDASSNLCSFSNRAAEILGVPYGEPQRRDFLSSFILDSDREAATAAVEKAIATKTGYDQEYRARKVSDGRQVWVSSKGRATYGSDGNALAVIGTIADISDRKLIEEDREKLLASESAARAEAEQANRIKDEFLATLSHELRTPLNAILGWASILKADHSDPAEVAAGLEVIERNAHFQTQMIADLLDMSRIMSGKIHIDSIAVDLTGVLKAALEAVRHSAEAAKIRVFTTVEPWPLLVKGDPARLQQIIWNLLTNAIKFTPEGGRIDVSLLREGNSIELIVRDTGSGIEAAFLPRVFDRFRQADSSLTRKHGGLGLGLSIVKTLTHLHGGTISAASAGLNQGAEFRVLIPLHSSPSVATTTELVSGNAPVAEASVSLAGASLLVVDDDPDGLEVVSMVLESRGASVVRCKSGTLALQALQNQRFHALVSDIGMPQMDGYELLRTVRLLDAEHGGKIPAVALTAFARGEDRQKALLAGFDTFVAKPVDTKELLDAVARCTGRGWHSPGEVQTANSVSSAEAWSSGDGGQPGPASNQDSVRQS